MDKRANIIRKLIALKAKLTDASNTTDAEKEAALLKYNELMQEYNVTEAEIGIKQSDIGRTNVNFNEGGKREHDVSHCIHAIARLSETRVIRNKKNLEYGFLGTRPDREYAEFLYRLCWSAIEDNWKAFRYSYPYTKMIKEGHHGRMIRNTFRKTVAFRLRERLDELVAMNATNRPGTALVLKKSELIQAYVDENLDIKKGGKKLTRIVRHDNVIMAAVDAANRVPLRHEVNEGTKKLEYQGEE
jgi:hypothetical protein